MTKALEDELNIPRLKEALEKNQKAEEEVKEVEAELEAELDEIEGIDADKVEQVTKALESLSSSNENDGLVTSRDLENLDEELDEIAEDSIEYYHDLMDLGFNSSPVQRARIFEVASSMVSNAINARTAKVDKKLKLMKLELEQARFDRTLAKDQGITATIEGEIIIDDRNKLLDSIREKVAKDNKGSKKTKKGSKKIKKT